jgi:phage terminase large subunit
MWSLPDGSSGPVATLSLDVATPAWALPLLAPARYKGAKGGRGSGKSHFFAELAVEEMVADPDLRFVCIREVQRSLKFSAKSLVEAKIRKLGVGYLFTVLEREIRRNGGTGVMIFEGMQDHTADSLKSLESFRRAWCEEAHALSKRSLDLLIPTIRADDSQLWFSWNPDQPGDAIDQLLVAEPPEGAAVVHVNYTDNPWCPAVLREEAARLARVDPDAYAHIWLGQYNTRSEAQILNGKWAIDEFTPTPEWDGPYHGADFGFAQDPTTLVRCWIDGRRLMIERESYGVGLELDHTAEKWRRDVPECEQYVIRADNARPESISYLQRHGVPRITSVDKWKGSVEDGIAFLRQFEQIVIHARCRHAADEARHWSYKVDARTGDVLPQVADGSEHIWDAVRYALAPLIRARFIDYEGESYTAATHGRL